MRLQISTVTYLTRDGAPTIVLDCSADTQYDKVHPAASSPTLFM
jgi:hypothetical protein